MAILITGATGHLGPHLLEALLRDPAVDRMFVAARGDAGSRVRDIERIARAQLASGGLASNAPVRVIPVDANLYSGDRIFGAVDDREIRTSVTVVVHAAADTRFGAPVDVLRQANVDTTRALCQFAERCPRLRQFLFVSTACVAGRRTGVITEDVHDAPDGFANAYEQSKWEAERVVIASGLPARLARLSTCAGSHRTGYVHRFGALHHLLHWLARGLIPMIPGSAETPIDLISTDLAASWIARAASLDPQALEICHVALGRDGIPLGGLLDAVLPLVNPRVQRPLLVDADVFSTFNSMVRLSGDALLARVQESAAAVLPSLLHPKVYETTGAERCWGGPLPHPEWRLMLARVIEFGKSRRWGFAPAAEACHA